MTNFWMSESLEQELMNNMEKAHDEMILAENQNDNNRIIQAMEELNLAANGFERVGKIARASEVTTIMLSLAEEKNRKKSKKIPSSEDEVKKVFMFFGFGPEDLEGLDFSSNGDSEDEE